MPTNKPRSGLSAGERHTARRGFSEAPMQWRGTWDSGTTYYPGDVVAGTYVALAESLAVEPGVTSGWESYWEEVAASASTAADVSIVDSGGHFTGTDVEAALQELGASSGGIDLPTALAIASLRP